LFRRLVLIVSLLLPLTSLAQIPVSIRTNNVKAHKTASTRAPVIATLHKGEVFVITDDQPYWYEITLRNGRAAWVPKSACSVVDKIETADEPADAPPPSSAPAVAPSTVTPPACNETSIPADWHVCPATGSGGMYAQAYIQKNRLKIPCSYSPMSISDMLGLEHLPKSVRALPETDNRAQYLKLAETKAVVLEGFLAMAKDGGEEGVNCKSGTRLDTHVELVDSDSEDPKSNRSRHVVAEVTPWFHEAITAWSTDRLGELASYVGGYSAHSPRHQPAKVRIYGYLFYDEAHATGAESWRGTAWEVHPITKIEVLEQDTWMELGPVH